MNTHLAEQSIARDGESDGVFEVVLNQEQQSSIWPAERTIPHGWRLAGKRGTRAACLAYIAEAWTDMRPLSLRQRMDRR